MKLSFPMIINSNLFLAATLAASIILGGCEALLVPATSDPLEKLNSAEYLFMKANRPIPAEKLILDAIKIYQERDDPYGLGHAYREYGDFLYSDAVSKLGWFYVKNGFLNKSITYDNRLEKAKEYDSKALEYFERAERQYIESKKFDYLTNVYINMAWCYFVLYEYKKSCEYYDKSLEAHNEFVRRNPGVKVQASPGYQSVPDFVASEKQKTGCE
jgi:tetratricopeptide (TPR) repeat protein